jgi:phenylalanyl-tRNA synthetase beta chain
LLNLMETLRNNIARGTKDVAVFEVRRVFHPNPKAKLPNERHNVAFLLSGRRYPQGWSQPEDIVDFFDAKGALEQMLEGLLAPPVRFEAVVDRQAAHPFAAGACAMVYAEDKVIGACGKVLPAVAEAFDIDQEIYAAEIDLESLLEAGIVEKSYTPISKFPAVHRDLALLTPKTVTAQTIIDAVRESGGELISAVWPFDVYSGENIPADKVSLAIRLRIGAADRSLSDVEADGVVRKALEVLEKNWSVKLRS